MQPLVAKIKFLISRIAEAWQLLRLTLFSAVLVILGGIFLVWVPQGQDLLRILAGETRNPYFRQHQIFFVIASLCWALAAWYCARVLVTRRLPTTPPDNLFQVRLRIWLPRIYGALALFVLAHGFWQVGERSWTLAYSILTIAFLIFVVKRRAWFGNFPGTVKTQVDSFPPTTRKLVYSSLALSFVLLGLFVAFPVRPAQMLGAMAVLLFAITSWIIFGSFVLVLLPKIYGWPSLALLPLFFFVVFSPFNDNHVARAVAPRGMPDCASIERNNTRCLNVSQHFSGWLKARLKQHRSADPYPLYIMAAEGGGIRAAYWAASVLGRLHECDAQFSEHVYAISGVSGGALGAAIYTTLLTENNSPAITQAQPCGSATFGSFTRKTQTILSQDFLSPLLAYLLYPDMLQRFLPLPIARFDRARALELSWESAWRTQVGNGKFGESFFSLWQNPSVAPALFFNSTVAETGKRVIISNLRVEPNEFHDALDGFADPLRLPEPALSTAVHYSARFAYVSPAARVDTGQGTLHLVDGGFHENTGAQTAADILLAVQDTVEREHLNARPIVVVVRNQPKGEEVFGHSEFLGEILQPLSALLKTRQSHTAYYLDTLEEALNRPGQVQQFFIVQPRATAKHAPLGWFMSRTSTDALDDSLKNSATQEKLNDILKVLKAPPSPMQSKHKETRP
ncbi:MAG: patatin-like phospholipase family protein [Burkholderiales bacterium]